MALPSPEMFGNLSPESRRLLLEEAKVRLAELKLYASVRQVERSEVFQQVRLERQQYSLDLTAIDRAIIEEHDRRMNALRRRQTQERQQRVPMLPRGLSIVIEEDEVRVDTFGSNTPGYVHERRVRVEGCANCSHCGHFDSVSWNSLYRVVMCDCCGHRYFIPGISDPNFPAEPRSEYWGTDFSQRSQDDLSSSPLSESQRVSIRAICTECKYFHGRSYVGEQGNNMLICAMHPYGNGEECSDYERHV